MIRVTIRNDQQISKVREYADTPEALKWLIDDGYFTGENIREIIWQSVPECEHRWSGIGGGEESLYIQCVLCDREVEFEHATLTRIARIKQR